MEKLIFAAIVWKEKGDYVSLCPQLDVSSFGDTKEKALEHLKEAVELYLEDEKCDAHQKAEVRQIIISHNRKK
ncbi:TPA: type II toxin-antitoxin system HicB family antitoxin [Candidatus Micrarchaeota archaeon]|nr:type II toxin-antitoxin system HicB family antitoxin [Candidatus Micrarchaeota archaeon]